MRNNNCILNLLKVIDLLQRNSSNQCITEEGCNRPFLGPTSTFTCYNTRPISLYTKEGNLYTLSNYSIFRVEKIDDDCVTLQALSGTDPNYTATGEFVSISPKCFCVIRCYPDTSITCL